MDSHRRLRGASKQKGFWEQQLWKVPHFEVNYFIRSSKCKHQFLINLCFSQVMGEADDELIVLKIVSHKGIMKEAKRGLERDFFMANTICLL